MQKLSRGGQQQNDKNNKMVGLLPHGHKNDFYKTVCVCAVLVLDFFGTGWFCFVVNRQKGLFVRRVGDGFLSWILT